MKNQFAKLFEFKNHQVLLTKDYDCDENGADEFLMNVSTALDSVQPAMKLSYKTEGERDAQFEKYTRESAKKFLDQMKKALEN